MHCIKTIALLAALGFTAAEAQAESLTSRYASRLTQPRSYDCFRTDGKIKIDGKLDEGAWKKAASTQDFVDISGFDKPTPAQRTSVKMLWDDENLYIGATIEEKNIIANLTQRDTIIYHDNDFEVFLDPDGDGLNYFEIENNARGVVFDLTLDKAYRSGGSFFIPWNCEGLQLKVSYDGTLNKQKDTDKAWYVEMAIPFKALERDFKNPRDMKVWRINYSRVEWISGQKAEENWVWSPTGRVDMHMPERWGFLNFIDQTVGTSAAKKDLIYDMNAYNLVWTLFYAQLDNHSKLGNYIRKADDFFLTPEDMKLLPAGGEIGVDATSSAFDVTVSVPQTKSIYKINQDGKFTVEKVQPRKVMNWAWTGLHKDWSDAKYKEYFTKLHNAGISAVLFEGYDERVYKLCKEAGLQAHYWKWTMNRRDFMKDHPEYYAVNKKGESSYDEPAYVDYYRFLCPSHPEVVKYLAEDYLKDAQLPYVDGMHLDYMRFPDVVLPVSLWKNYGIKQTEELPEYDFCYCELCRKKFKELTGRDPMDDEFPQEDQSWINFRLDAITNVVKNIADSVRSHGHFLSSAVFPGPSMAKRMVRQDWGNWNLNAYFPMIYNGFYYEGPEWVGRSVQEGVAAINGRGDLYAGLMCPDLKGKDFIEAVDLAYKAGASGVSFFAGPSDEQLKELREYLDKNNYVPAN